MLMIEKTIILPVKEKEQHERHIKLRELIKNKGKEEEIRALRRLTTDHRRELNEWNKCLRQEAKERVRRKWTLPDLRW